MGNVRYKNGNARRKIRQRLKSLKNPCALCGRPIDYNLPAGHPFSFEVDEKIPVSKGGSPIAWENVQAVHRICNQRKGNGRKSKPINLPIATSKDW